MPKSLSVVLLCTALVAGVWLRVARLAQTPPGIYPDEACNGYDAYSILKTGRDHHGNFLPILVQGFNDYRRPLYDYSLIPLVATFGLNISAVRLGAALWGVVDILAAVSIAGYLLGQSGAAVTAILLAFSPWLLPLNRYGIEASATSALGTLSVLSFLLALRHKNGRWLPLSGACFGLALYSGSIAVLFIPMLMALLALLFWREIIHVRMKAALAVIVFGLIAMPQAVVLLAHPGQMQGHFTELSLIHATTNCVGCPLGNKAPASTPIEVINNFVAAWAGYLNPLFLFLNGDQGGHWELLYSPGIGMLLPEQALLIAFALFAALTGTRRRTVGLLLGWLALAAIPAAMLVPAGAVMPEGDNQLPTPINLITSYQPYVPISPGLLFNHPEARHDLFAIIPWILLSAVGFVALIEYGRRLPVVKNALLAAILLGIGLHSFGFIRSYFGAYRVTAEPYFSSRLDDAIQAAIRLRKSNAPVVISNRIAQGYIQAAFVTGYPPALMQKDGLRYDINDYPPALHPHAQPIGFGPFLFEDFEAAFQGYPSALFIITGADPAQDFLAEQDSSESRLSPVPRSNLARLQTFSNTDGTVAYEVYRKDTASCTPEENIDLGAGLDTTICTYPVSTPSSGGPWRAYVSWNAILNNIDPAPRSIECYVTDGTNRYPAVHGSVLPDADQKSWYVTPRTSHDIGPYNDGTSITLQWHCQASDSLTMLRARPDLLRLSYASVYFVSDLSGKTNP